MRRMNRILTAILWGLSGMALAQSPTATVSPSPTASPSRTPTPTRTPSPTSTYPAVFRAGNGFDELESTILFMNGLAGPVVIRDGTWGVSGSGLATNDGTGRLYWVSPTPSPSPTASPTPSASPTASPTPSASPTVSPSPTGTWLFEFKHGSVNDVTDTGASYDATNDAPTFSGWLRVGTATEADAAGDLSAGLTGDSRMHYDQGYAQGSLVLYNGFGSFQHILTGGGNNSEFNVSQTSTDGFRWGSVNFTDTFSVAPEFDEAYVNGYFRMNPSTAVVDDAGDYIDITTNDVEVGDGTVDDLDTINTSQTEQGGWLLWMHPAAASDITLTESGNMALFRPTILLDDPSDQAVFRYDSALAKWCLIAFSDNDGAMMVTTFLADGTYTMPWWAEAVEVVCIGAGGGAGGGSGYTAGNARPGGTSGGGGAYARKVFDAADVSSPVTVTVGVGGTGGTGGTGGAHGNSGHPGENTSFGTYLSAGGGGAGRGATAGSASSGGGGGGTGGVGANGTNSSVAGGVPGGLSTTAVGGNGAASPATAVGGGCAEFGGGGGGGHSSTPQENGPPGGSSIYGAGGGGSGGGCSSAIPGSQGQGGAGGTSGTYTTGGGGALGTVGGNPGTDGADGDSTTCGSGGGGGGGNNAGTGGAGGNGGFPGGGGGGGGGGTSTGGDGGDGADGYVIVITHGRH